MKKHVFGLGLLTLAVMAAAPAFAGRIEPQTIASAGTIECVSTHLRMGATVGLPASGFSSSSGLRCVTGFWQDFTAGGGAVSCCVGRVGNVNGQGVFPNEITLADISMLIDVKYISGNCGLLLCLPEADVNQNGGANPNCGQHITLGDIATLIDFLYITGSQNATLNNCL